MLKQWILTSLLFGVMINYGACNLKDFEVVTTPCSPDSFDQGSCTIKCAVTTDGTAKLNSWCWQYFTTSATENVVIYDGVEQTSQGNTYTTSLTLDDYNAGTYQCLFEFTNNPQPLNGTIKISQSPKGADLTENCSANHDCNAMHASCVLNSVQRKVCKCSVPYNITYSSEDTLLSCYKLQPNGGHCYSQMECDWPTQSYVCQDSKCQCTGKITDVHLNNTVTKMCLQPAYLMEDCFYDEQCQMWAKHTVCFHYEDGSSMCDCQMGYIMWMPSGTSNKDMYCFTTGLRRGEIIGVAVGSAVAFAIIVAIIVYFVKNDW